MNMDERDGMKRTAAATALLASLLLLSGCAIVSKKNIRYGNARQIRYSIVGIPIYSSTEAVSTQ